MCFVAEITREDIIHVAQWCIDRAIKKFQVCEWHKRSHVGRECWRWSPKCSPSTPINKAMLNVWDELWEVAEENCGPNDIIGWYLCRKPSRCSSWCVQRAPRLWTCGTSKHTLIRSSRCDYAITIQYRLPALFTLPFHHVAAITFIPVGN
jgi:hypothetical protein